MRSVSLVGFAVGVAVLGVALAGCTIVQAPPGYIASGAASLEANVNRPGSDYRSFDLASGQPEECRDTCAVEPQCVAFTFVNPGVQGPSARCWLKSAVPPPNPNACCVSGVKNAAPATADYAGAPPPPPPPPHRGRRRLRRPATSRRAGTGAGAAGPFRSSPTSIARVTTSRTSTCPSRGPSSAATPVCASSSASPSPTCTRACRARARAAGSRRVCPRRFRATAAFPA